MIKIIFNEKMMKLIIKTVFFGSARGTRASSSFASISLSSIAVIVVCDGDCLSGRSLKDA